MKKENAKYDVTQSSQNQLPRQETEISVDCQAWGHKKMQNWRNSNEFLTWLNLLLSTSQFWIESRHRLNYTIHPIYRTQQRARVQSCPCHYLDLSELWTPSCSFFMRKRNQIFSPNGSRHANKGRFTKSLSLSYSMVEENGDWMILTLSIKW